MSDAHLPIIGQARPFRVLREGAQQKVPTLTALPIGGKPPLGARFMGLATAVHETTEGPALAITVQGPAGIAVTALVLAAEIVPAMEAINASAGRIAEALAPTERHEQ